MVTEQACMQQGSLSELKTGTLQLRTTLETPPQIEGSLYSFRFWFTIGMEACNSEWHDDINALTTVEEAQSCI